MLISFTQGQAPERRLRQYDDYPEKLVEGLTVGESGIDHDDSIVTRLLAWVARASGRSKDKRYEMTRHDAAVLLEQLAGYPDCLYLAAGRPKKASAAKRTNRSGDRHGG